MEHNVVAGGIECYNELFNMFRSINGILFDSVRESLKEIPGGLCGEMGRLSVGVKGRIAFEESQDTDLFT